jgi:hypothetical protein
MAKFFREELLTKTRKLPEQHGTVSREVDTSTYVDTNVHHLERRKWRYLRAAAIVCLLPFAFLQYTCYQ